MPENLLRYARYHGYDDSDGLTAYVMTEHLRESEMEFDVFQTALDLSSTLFRLFIAFDKACIESFQVNAEARNTPGLGLLQVGDHFTPMLGLCDRDRLLDYMDGLTGDHQKQLATFGLSRADRVKLLPELNTADKLTAYRKPVQDKLLAIVKERVKVTVIAKDRVIAMAQATGGPGKPLEVRRYKGGTNVNGVALGECKLHKSGLIIIKKATGLPADEKVTEIKNELSGHVVKLKATADTTPKGQAREVKRVKSGAALTLTGKDHRKSWVVSATEVD